MALKLRRGGVKPLARAVLTFSAGWWRVLLAAVLIIAGLRIREQHKQREVQILGGEGHRYFLAAVICNRVFADDRFNITLSELKQWLEYVRYGGVEHVFWYDTAKSDAESQEVGLAEYVREGFVTYYRWQTLFGRKWAGATLTHNDEQNEAHEHCMGGEARSAHWLLECDIDEYPVSPSNLRPGFLVRALWKAEMSAPQVSQWLMQNVFFVGNPVQGKGLLIERYQRREFTTRGVGIGEQFHVKPILRPADFFSIHPNNPHFMVMRAGDTRVLPEKVLRQNHYWGLRPFGFSPVSTEVAEKDTVEETLLAPIAKHIRETLHIDE